MDYDEKQELLLLAAKSVSDEVVIRDGIPQINNWEGRFIDWDPIDCDSDAFWLLVKLNLQVSCYPTRTSVVTLCDNIYCEDAGEDRYAATRMAIVKAAAGLAAKRR